VVDDELDLRRCRNGHAQRMAVARGIPSYPSTAWPSRTRPGVGRSASRIRGARRNLGHGIEAPRIQRRSAFGAEEQAEVDRTEREVS
jgi:hypothetical protein